MCEIIQVPIINSVDYMRKMALELERAINFEEEKAIYKRICAYSRENNVPIITAKQTNKHSIVLNVDVE